MLLSSRTPQSSDLAAPPGLGPLPEADPVASAHLTGELSPLPFAASGRVLARYGPLERSRGQELIRRVLQLDQSRIEALATRLTAEYGQRHRELESLLTYHFHQVLHLMPKARAASLSPAHKLVLGAYFTQEIPIEAGGLCCPALIPAPDAANRLICAFQALGLDGHTSLVFREAELDDQLQLKPLPLGSRIAQPRVEEFPERPLSEIEPLMRALPLSPASRKQLLKQLSDPFVYTDLFQVIDQLRLNCGQPAERKALQQVLEAVDDYYDLDYGPSTSLSERVLAPMLDHESRGLEDARFVKFSDAGRSTYYATYTANGQQSQQRLLQTDDFVRFRSYSLHVPAASQLALFPRKIKGRYAMLAQVDKFQFCLFFSERLTRWSQSILIEEPREPWELAALGNCGAPIETPQGWLVISQGLGPMGKLALSVCLLDRNDPTRMIGRLREPLTLGSSFGGDKITSSGSLLVQDQLLIPFAYRHQAPQLLVLELKQLLAQMK